MTDTLFFAIRAFFITIMTIGMMASLTEFRFERKKLLLILMVYSVWVIACSVVLLWIGGELLLLRLFYLTISVPAIVLTYYSANDNKGLVLLRRFGKRTEALCDLPLAYGGQVHFVAL